MTKPLLPGANATCAISMPKNWQSAASASWPLVDPNLRRKNCDECVLKKIKCTEDWPCCGRCAKKGLKCTYSAKRRPGPQKRDSSTTSTSAAGCKQSRVGAMVSPRSILCTDLDELVLSSINCAEESCAPTGEKYIDRRLTLKSTLSTSSTCSTSSTSSSCDSAYMVSDGASGCMETSPISQQDFCELSLNNIDMHLDQWGPSLFFNDSEGIDSATSADLITRAAGRPQLPRTNSFLDLSKLVLVSPSPAPSSSAWPEKDELVSKVPRPVTTPNCQDQSSDKRDIARYVHNLEQWLRK